MSQNKLYVGNLSFDTTEQGLSGAFSPFGKVDEVSLPLDRETGRPRGFAFVMMATGLEAEAARQGLDGRVLDGRALRVDVAREDRKRAPRRSE